MSACVKWAKQRLDDFNHLLAKQLGSVRPGSETWRDCVGRAREHAGLMAEVGLDFRDLVGFERTCLTETRGETTSAMGRRSMEGSE